MMFRQLLYFFSCWFYIVFSCFFIIIIITTRVFKAVWNLIAGKKIQNLIDYHPDIFLNNYQFMTLEGYQIKEYKVKTDDGYDLVLWRIITLENKNAQKKTPVLMLHGLLDCGMTWFGQENLKECLPYLLTFEGHDVWIGNNRGTRFTKENCNREGFWNYTFDELAKYDVTKLVSTVLLQSQSESLVFIGHSQGSLQLMAAITQGYLEEQKIKSFIGCGPVLSVFNNTSSILLQFITNFCILQLFIWLGFKCTLHLPTWSTRAFGVLICNNDIVGEFGFSTVNLFCGFPKHHKLSYKQLARIFSNQPGGCSLTNILHWKQFAMGEKMKFFDYGKKKNLQLYKSKTPPEYSFHKIMNINFPKLIFIGTSDVIMKHSLISQEYYNKNSEVYFLQDYNHNDYLWSATAKQDLFDHALDFLKKSN